jgi:hypothetical protein
VVEISLTYTSVRMFHLQSEVGLSGSGGVTTTTGYIFGFTATGGGAGGRIGNVTL